MTSLKPVNVGMNRWCGPAVLSILTGKNTDECAAAIRKVYPAYAGVEVPYDQLLRAADYMGFNCERMDTASTLYGTIVRLALKDGIYIIMVPRHVVTIEVLNKTAFFCDNTTKEPIPAASSARLGQRVLAAHRVSERPRPPEPEKPVFLETIYTSTVNFTYHSIDIHAKEVYLNHADNKEYLWRSIACEDSKELGKILEALKEMVVNEGF